MFAAVALLTLVLADPPKAPDLGFDYKSMILSHVQAVVDGKGDRALEILDTRASHKDWFVSELREATRKHFSKIHAASTKSLGNEIVGYRQPTSRIIRIYAVSHHERFAITYIFTFMKNTKDEWHLEAYMVAEGVDELEKFTPFVPLSTR